jgi:hypothetical protein
MLLIDLSTGTVLTAEHCVIIPDSALTESDWDALDDMSDEAVIALGRTYGKYVVS